MFHTRIMAGFGFDLTCQTGFLHWSTWRERLVACRKQFTVTVRTIFEDEKTSVMALVERGGRVRVMPLARVTADDVQTIIRQEVSLEGNSRLRRHLTGFVKGAIATGSGQTALTCRILVQPSASLPV